MPLRDRGYIRLPFVRVNWARRGLLGFRYTSTTFHLGPWSWNTRNRKHHLDHPGPGWWESGQRQGRARRFARSKRKRGK
jgi:hypothetical protein